MPTYSTPTPIDLAINLQVGRLDIIASDRTDTVVTVSPSNATRAVDRRGAEDTKVDFDGQRLTIKGRGPRLNFIGPTESVDVKVELPTGSRLTAEVAVGGVRTSGRLGATRVKGSMGPVDLDQTGDLWLRAGHGNATVGTADGGAEITADHGQIRVGTVTGDSTLKASHGSIQVGESGGALEAKLSYGDLEVATALGSVSAKTAYGSIRIGEACDGSVEVESAFGAITIGVRQGVPAWLDLSSKEGHVRNELTGDSAPAASEQTVAIRARTQFGDIDITRTRAQTEGKEEMIETHNLRKSYGEKVVLDGVDLSVAPGTVTALLGPNGAGKTTMVHILSTLVRPDGGTASVDGFDVVRDAVGVRASIGLTGQFSAVDGLLTGEENLLLMARLRHLGAKRSKTRVTELLEQFDLVDAARKPISTYSGGMKRRLDLAMTLVATPRVIFLDEPTTGLDPRSRHTMWDIVRRLVADGTTVLLTTQYLDEADELADHIAVLDGGRIVAQGTPDELKRLVPGGHIRLRFADAAALATATALLADSVPQAADLTLSVPSDGGVSALRGVLDRLDAAHLEVDDLSIHTPDLDDVFFALTGKKGKRIMTTITAPSHVFSDAITMLRRNLLHIVRYPGLSMFTILGPVVILLLTVFVFGGTLGAGLPGVDAAGGRDAYLAYVVPGILLITIAGTASGVSITVAMDMTEGITARFRTMAISRAAVLAGHVLGNTIQAIIAVALVLGVSIAVGFRPSAGLAEWLAAAGLIVLISFAVSWIGVAMGMQSKTVETASNLPLILTILPLLGSGFVPTASMPAWLQWFAQYQPFTPFIETVRGLLLGTPLGLDPMLAIGWCVVLTIAGFAWAVAIYERKSVR